ncbi:sugar phosphate nucleotidyltransferase [Alicyclobacillus fastidiosus]|uniref:Sugar phosphate nucleotidyltransferase n=1 Tax=Alicyclobacillus fastidiosus TaxID=392011 RepID=A0ABV5AG80_9BACL|nr:sugar phosphate nucleotidyltransferase [Alicyclobacillus fastidiosus]WEH08891.1 sugar phosphate nucleotidyltransferase [Alicyclobacillus fastidiosus]
MEAVIITGGKGLRLAPFTKVLPKGLLPIGEQPMLEIIVKQLRNHGFTTIHMACGYLSSLIQTYFQNGERWGVDIDYVVEKEPLGTIGPLKMVPLISKQPVLVMNCDVLTTLNFRDMMNFHMNGTSLLTIASQKKSVPIEFGVLQTDGSRVTQFLEKPGRSEHVSMGIYVVSPALIDYIPRDKYYDMPDLILRLLASQQEVRHFENESFWLDVGRPDDFAKAGEVFPRIEAELMRGSPS